MFVELMPLLAGRTLLITVAKVDDKTLRVNIFHYARTMQEACLRLMGKKLLVSLAREGKFATDGLQAIDEGDDILMAMARELVTEKEIGESTDAVWKALVEKQAEVFGVRTVETPPSEMQAEPPERDVGEGFSRERPNVKRSPILMPINSDRISCRIYLACVSFAKS